MLARWQDFGIRPLRPARSLAIAALAILVASGATASVRVPLLSKSSQFVKRKMLLGDWQLQITRGKFSGDIACRLRSRNGKIVYVADALGFRFGKHLDVMNAWVRIDGGEAYRWRNDLPELARLGVAIGGKNLDVPTDGIVWIPAAGLVEVNRVDVQPRPDKRPRTFHLRGFAGLRDIARTMGCTPEVRFIG